LPHLFVVDFVADSVRGHGKGNHGRYFGAMPGKANAM
jgi:hypothetical protein